MARKSEAGLSYFPLNSDIVTNPKIKLVVAEFGPKAWAVLLPLYCKIYREKGYWVDWLDEDGKLLFAQDECRLDVPFVDEVVAGCIRRSLFNKAVFDMFGVLTSDRIQANYFEGKKRSKEIFFIEEFLVENEDVDINGENVNIIPLNVDIITKKVNTGTQKRGRKRIEEEGEGESAGAPTHTQEEKDMFKAFTEWVLKYTPRVNKMKEPITIDEYLKLREKVSKDVLTKILTAMQNRADLLRKYVSAYLTALNWAGRENETPKPDTTGSSINDKLKSAGKKTE